MELVREHWSGLLCPPPGHLTDGVIEPVFVISSALTGSCFFFFFKLYIDVYDPVQWKKRDDAREGGRMQFVGGKR